MEDAPISEDIVEDAELVRTIQLELSSLALQSGVSRDEIPVAIALLGTPWSPRHHGLLNLHLKKMFVLEYVSS